MLLPYHPGMAEKNYKKRYPGNATVMKHNPSKAPKKGERKDRINVTYEITRYTHKDELQ